MTVYECDGDCSATYTVGEGEATDGMFVSFSVTPHEVDSIEKRAFSLCADCARELDVDLPGGCDD